MTPARKKFKAKHVDDGKPGNIPATTVPNYGTAWLDSDDREIELVTQDATLRANKQVLASQSGYFKACLNGSFIEADGVVRFDDIDSKHLSSYIGLAYSHSSIVPPAPPPPTRAPEFYTPQRPLKDLVEVYKLCDRFLSPTMAKFMYECIRTAILDGHRALFRRHRDEERQKLLMRDFADAFEILEAAHKEQAALGALMVSFFCGGVDYKAWAACGGTVEDRPRFVAAVSRQLARQLQDFMEAPRRQRRKERQRF